MNYIECTLEDRFHYARHFQPVDLDEIHLQHATNFQASRPVLQSLLG